MKKPTRLLLAGLLFFSNQTVFAQADTAGYWHGKERSIRYKPDGEDFIITNGNRKFTRALYGTNTAFRVETGDLPEFALYLPGMGGNIKTGIIKNGNSKWLTTAAKVTARYTPGKMQYEIEDELLGKGKLLITVLAMANAEGVIIKIDAQQIDTGTRLVLAYGAASGRNFSRNGDMGPDPESVFYMRPEYCKNNEYTINNNEFSLQFGAAKKQWIGGVFPAAVKIVNVNAAESPLHLLQSNADSLPVIAAEITIKNKEPLYLSIAKKDSAGTTDKNVAGIFKDAETARQKIAGRIKVQTPDPYINTIGAAIGIAADAIWESPSFMHGAIGWRMRLNGWRGAYAADVLGWHDRAREHFRAYAKSQMTSPASGPIVADTALNLARHIEKLGTAVFSSGYISRNPNGDFRPHHYDMNLGFIDQLLWHFNWTGDTAFAKEMWPLLTRHLAWEKRNFDTDDDGLYDAYAAIWASDALQYSSGAVTHSSAYNYRANKMVALLADMIGEDGSAYKKEAEKILNAINKVLWMKDKGVYAEFKDALGEKLLHKNPAVWSIYHSIDSDIADEFQAYQCIQYINNSIPHIPIKAKGLQGDFYTISTTNWMPYTWSINNVALAELMHTSLAMWQGGNNEEAFTLWKSSLLESMYMGGSPGNFHQISTYDAARGEAYRDFADPVGMTARSLVQGLFGILPDALNDKLLIKPGFPLSWNQAALSTPDIDFSFIRNGKKDEYKIKPFFNKQLSLQLVLRANGNSIKSIIVNNRKLPWRNMENAIDIPMIELHVIKAAEYRITIEWEGNLNTAVENITLVKGDNYTYSSPNTIVKELYDPQLLFSKHSVAANKFNGTVTHQTGNKTAFIKIQRGNLVYWKAINALVKNPIEFIFTPNQTSKNILLQVKNNAGTAINASIIANEFLKNNALPLVLKAKEISPVLTIQEKYLIPGSNTVVVKWNNNRSDTNIINWNIVARSNSIQQSIDLSSFYNDKVSNIFKNKYLTPRPAVPTLQLPVQGIGDWTHPKLTAEINDSGFRKMLINNQFKLPQNIFFSSPADSNQKNIVFTSQWDNFPTKTNIPLSGQASHAYFLMAGSTNPMQSQMINGKIMIHYTDGSRDSLLLKNPESWWPIEQDYLNDGYAFNTNAGRSVRVHLKTGKTFSNFNDAENVNNGKLIDGGAATVLDLPLNQLKTLQSATLETLCNDVI
ncbi:MAG: DUF4450 domain-containing protein, partial [Sphingobacteriales bacterium]